ncbi:unnamed protein product [Symbiodinium pilosum]|uniref:Uncharacterized protein n=1 Tax=Symbiodinium pilosum TaxID=2952 RepID=A0A812WT27_SYMPI|nr:unnamed protein product [Symbiodinium pilosum]
MADSEVERKHAKRTARVSFDWTARAPNDLQIDGVELLTGLYVAQRRLHHGQQVFRKAAKGGLQAKVLFYWKERSCSPSGWWFCDEIGSHSAYAFARGEGGDLSEPPEDGWVVPVQGQPVLRGLCVKMQRVPRANRVASKTTPRWQQAWDRNRIWSGSDNRFKKALLGHWRGTNRMGVPQTYEVVEERRQLWCKIAIKGQAPSWRRISISIRRNKAYFGTGDMSLDLDDVKKQPKKLVWRSERTWKKAFTWSWAGWS